METKLLASGVEYELTECAIIKLIIPPLEMPDGRKILLRQTDIVFPPFRALITDDVNGGKIKALFYPTEGRWELVKDGEQL